MKFQTLSPFLLLAWGAAAVVATRDRDLTSYIVTYNPDTPDSVIDNDIKQAKENGAIITHRYQIIKGYSVDSPSGMDALNFVHANDYAGKEYQPNVEEDQVVTTQGRKKRVRSG